MSDPLYVELFRLFSTHRDQRHDYFMRGNQAASWIANSVFQALGLPDENFETGQGSKPWVQLYSYNEDGAVEETTWSELSDWDKEGRLRFAVGVALSSAVNSYPKVYFWIAYSLRIEDEQILVSEIHGSRQTFDVSSDDGLNALVTAYFASLRECLRRSPQESFKAKPGIGFI